MDSQLSKGDFSRRPNVGNKKSLLLRKTMIELKILIHQPYESFSSKYTTIDQKY